MTPILIRTHSPLHVGVGQSPSALDLPIARDPITGAPHIPASSLKGALRARYAQTSGESDPKEEHIFGPIVRGAENASYYSGALEIHDATVLLFPVPSPLSGWAWITSPLALAQLYAYMTPDERARLPLPRPALNEAHGPHQMMPPWTQCETFWARDLDFKFKQSTQMHAWIDWIVSAFALDQDKSGYLHRRLVCLNDETAALVWQQMTHIVTRNRIDPETGVVADGALWNEEQAPTDTFFVSNLTPITARCDHLGHPGAALTRAIGQRCSSFVLGGKVSIGRGLCALILKQDPSAQETAQ